MAAAWFQKNSATCILTVLIDIYQEAILSLVA